MKKNLLGVSIFTLAMLYAMLSVVVLGVCLVLDVDMLIGITICIAVLIIQFLISPYLTNLSLKWFYHARFDVAMPEYLNKFIEEECQKHNMKKPIMGYIDDGSPNAFTYGHTKNDARIVVTKGIFDLLSEEEVKAVVAHEIGHAVHYDMLLMTVAQLVPLVLYYIYEALCRNSDGDDKGKGQAIGLIAYVFYIISQYVILWFSRTREYYADEFSVKETRNPNALASALVKIGFGLITNSSSGARSTKNIGALGLFDSKESKSLIVMTNNNPNDKTTIKNAMKWEMWNPWAFIYELKSTHPLISKRLNQIAKYAKDYSQEPYVNFDLQKDQSYVDNFLFELFLKYLPILTFIGTFILCIAGSEEKVLFHGSLGLLVTIIASFLGFKRSHRSGYQKANVAGLLSVVDVSGITSVSCEVTGKIIGRGNPGYIFNEDFMIKDETGIVYVDYNTPLWLLNKIFAIFKNGNNIDKEVTVQGWYRRSPIPYIEINKYTIDGKTKSTGVYVTSLVIYGLFTIASIVGIIAGLV